MLASKAVLNSLLKAKAPLRIVPVASYSDGGFHDERIPIGKREWVGPGISSIPHYVDKVDYPMPAVRYKEIVGDLVALREKEKGDWKKLSMEEKKKIYRANFRQTVSEVYAPTGQWKSVLGWTLGLTSIGVMMFILQKLYIVNPLPDSFDEDYRRLTFRIHLVNRDGHLNGISSKWDYEKDDWK